MEELAAYLGPVIQARVARALWQRRSSDAPLRETVNQRAQRVFSGLFAHGARLLGEWDERRGVSLRDYVLDVAKLDADTCDFAQELLDRYALGVLSPADRRELERRAASDRDFADRVELYRPLDTYERRLLVEHALREPVPQRTRRRPFLVTFGALASAALGVGLVMRGCSKP